MCDVCIHHNLFIYLSVTLFTYNWSIYKRFPFSN